MRSISFNMHLQYYLVISHKTSVGIQKFLFQEKIHLNDKQNFIQEFFANALRIHCYQNKKFLKLFSAFF